MSFGGDELTPLFQGPAAGGVSFRQGVVVAWDQNTAENLIDVGGSLLTNLPILNTSEAVLLTTGAVVGILSFGSQMYIQGRITVPGTADAATSLAIDRTTAAYDTGAFAPAGTSYSGGSPTVDVVVGKSGRLMVTVGCQIDSSPPVSAASTACGGRMSFALSGLNSAASANDRAFVGRLAFVVSGTGPANGQVSGIWRGSYAHFLTGLTPGLTTVTAQYSRTDTGSVASMADRSLIVMPY